jgi:hypothetical protein
MLRMLLVSALAASLFGAYCAGCMFALRHWVGA